MRRYTDESIRWIKDVQAHIAAGRLDDDEAADLWPWVVGLAEVMAATMDFRKETMENLRQQPLGELQPDSLETLARGLKEGRSKVLAQLRIWAAEESTATAPTGRLAEALNELKGWLVGRLVKIGGTTEMANGERYAMDRLAAKLDEMGARS